MNIQREFIKALSISIIIFFVLESVNYLYNRHFPDLTTLKWHLLFTLLYGIVLYFINAMVFVVLDKIFIKNRFHVKRLIVGFLASFFISGLAVFVLRIVEEVLIEKVPFSQFIKEETPNNYMFTIVITLIVTLVLHLVYFYKSFQENRVKQERIIAGTASAQFESLKNQLDPHFLFNSLNVLSSLIEENQDQAQRFTTSLSKIYRYVLEQRDKELVSVQEEVAFAKTYMNLLKMRFENSISFEIPEDIPLEESKVVPLSLQLLLENCIKHNVVSEKKPLHIRIYIDNNELIVENNKQKKEVLRDRKGVGLQNIVDRYAILTERNVKVEETDESFKVKLPILTKQISIMETITNYNEQTAYARAKKRVKEIKEFYGNLSSYLIVIPVLMLINYKTFWAFQWFWFPMLGWGMGLIFHAIRAFGYGRSWEERKVQEILRKEQESKNNWQ
ncbi:histidine kinase [Flavobacterium sediminis]|uniref:Histidine kinase n=1 Tax=Flavobacterium sediminis TaxID=2201181 RepID=A0A2U8QZE3_9FLAO|nr:histidine kinase [Flavobacterium sediminis]AWM15234.1 histidine kinase [Flavobacterium sediminis]